jgi:predicted helicase
VEDPPLSTPATQQPDSRGSRKPRSLSQLIADYYAALKDLAHQNVLYEMGVRPAFHFLLQTEGKKHGWTLIAEHEKKVNGRTIRPDGTFKDQMNLVRGYWEAKDTSDKLDAETEKKRKAGYPLNNIIFEDTATAVLYQHGARILEADMKDPDRLAELVTQFFRYVEPEIEEFEHAVDEFKERVPDLAEGLAKKIAHAHKTNPAFKQAFADFFELCKTSLNPNLSQAAVDEMLIQHILTERLIREIFDNPEFVRRNVIAAEVEKVMQAMTSQSFDRNTYLKDLDRFYLAIEHAARTMQDWSDKQYFLNTVYERFFQGYSVKLADTMGIVYTPQEIVDFMCASVAEVLEKEFGKKLWSDDVYIIDPCTGTGNFIVNLIRRIPKAKLEDVYKHRLFANEIMLLPYYIAALNIEHAYYEQEGKYEPFEGLCFVDTLDIAQHQQAGFDFFTQANSERVKRQRAAPITVVVGNPPYNIRQQNENDNNKNRVYEVVDDRIRSTYAKDSQATLKNQLYDPYVKFFRWACDRLGTRDGIVCFVSNNSFLDQRAFDGMRKHLLRDFTEIYHLDLKGNVRQNPKLSGTAYNVFGIQVGVGITVAVRKSGTRNSRALFSQLPENLRREEKLGMIARLASLKSVSWQELQSDAANNWMAGAPSTYDDLPALGTKQAKSSRADASGVIFQIYSPGAASGRDDSVYCFDSHQLASVADTFIDNYCAEVERFARKGAGNDIDHFVDYSKVKWSRNLKAHLRRGRRPTFGAGRIRNSSYRPFTKRFIYFDEVLIDSPGQFRAIFPTEAVERENRTLIVGGYGRKPFSVSLANVISDLNYYGDPSQVFPFYVYDEDGTNRRENITDWALNQFRAHYKDKKIDKWAIFHYVYGLLHHPGYREKFADNLKRELPRIPFAPDFKAFAEAGKKLAALHLDYEKLQPWQLDFIETPGEPLSYRVKDKMRLSKDKTQLKVNGSLTLFDIPAEALDYRLGNRSALEWVIDQYQVSTDKRSGITSDPNRPDDEQYIVRLVRQVIRVSVETVGIVKGLPAEFA